MPFTKYYWRVNSWDQSGVRSVSSVAAFETGMMDVSNWKGAWISDGTDIDLKPAPYFRKQFSAERKIRSARAYIAAAGLYELSINGSTVGNQRLDPGYTRFDRRVLYVTHDVTSYLKEGSNAIGVLLGNESAPALGRARDREDWIQIYYPGVPGSVGWVWALQVGLSPGARLPEIEIPPTPTPQSTPTINPTLEARFIGQQTPTRLLTFTPPASTTLKSSLIRKSMRLSTCPFRIFSSRSFFTGTPTPFGSMVPSGRS